ncbi:MAG: T9SS type A sorting domain-containing protein [Bacteroidota bacterium]|nr:T9SS type A sorting domain-containing protein [Bacteroidota bacterium]MDP3144539.1 T9SS type A sorting domain-containing protein [Bacteroidota bacterium]
MRKLLLLSLFFSVIVNYAQPTFTMATTFCEQNSLTVTSNNGTLTVSGYTWSSNPVGPTFAAPNNSTTSITFPSSGIFTITLATTSGTNSYSFDNSITVNSIPILTLNVVNSLPICPPPTNIGGLNMTGDGAVTYTWMPSALNGSNVVISPQPISNTTYTLFGTDANGCIGEISQGISVYGVPSVAGSANSPVCAGDNVCLNASGSLQIWYWSGPCGYSSFNQNDCFTAVGGCGGVYTIGGSDANSCANSATVSVVINVIPVLSASSSSNILCSGQNATLTAVGATNYTWTPGGNGSNIVVSPTVNSTYTITGANGTCTDMITFTQTVSIDCAWPGDANLNGIANNTDILEIGLQFNQTGPARTSTSNAWAGTIYSPWTGSVSTGKNKANADCNGDGVVNLDDTLAVYLNFNLTHTKAAELLAPNPDISIVPDQTDVSKNKWGSASIYLGDVSNSISNIHGVSFDLNYDNSIIETDSVWIEYISSFVNSNNLHFRKRMFSNGVLHTATTHTNQVNASGNGKIAVLHYKIKPTLTSNTILNLGIINGIKMSASAVSSTLSSGSATLNAVVTDVSIKESSLSSHILVYPNPSSGQITIKQFDNVLSADRIEIYNCVGQLVFLKEFNLTNITVDTNLPKGIFFYSLSNSNGQTLRNKLIIE